jgi:hypothetical protein
MSVTAESRFKSGFRYSGGTPPREQASPAIGIAGQPATSVLIEQRDRALRLLQQSHEDAHQRIEALVAAHDSVIASMVAYHQRELDALQARLDSAEHGGHERRPTTIPESSDLGIGSVIEGAPNAGSEADALERQQRELRSELAAANAEIEETRADAIRLQGERDDALGEADDVRLRILTEIGAGRDEAIQVQAQLDEALRMLDDSRDQAHEEQRRLIEELDALHQELAACRQKLA